MSIHVEFTNLQRVGCCPVRLGLLFQTQEIFYGNEKCQFPIREVLLHDIIHLMALTKALNLISYIACSTLNKPFLCNNLNSITVKATPVLKKPILCTKQLNFSILFYQVKVKAGTPLDHQTGAFCMSFYLTWYRNYAHSNLEFVL